jgi:serine/threonine protein kinase
MIPTPELIAGRYRVIRLIGRGGMSDVYAAVDQRDGTEVAVKMVRSAEPELARRLAQEARALEGFAHPGLVRLLDTGVFDDQAYLVMELVTGSTLAQILHRGPLGPADTAALGANLGEALAYVHGRGVVHRDVKPANILVGDGQARLGDFGIAQLLDASTLTIAGTTVGTASYMAPEQLENHRVGPSADVWSLGVVLLECLTGRRVYEGTPSEVIARRLAGPVPIPDNLPVPWKLMLTGMLDHRADQRLEAGEVATLLGTSAFSVPWDPTGPTGPLDLTAPHAPIAFADVAEPDATAVLADQDTRVASSPPSARPGSGAGLRWWWLAVLGLVIAGLGVGVLLASRGPGHGHPTSATSTTRSTPTTRAPSPSTTTPTTPTTQTGPTALAALVRDVASGVSAGTVDPGGGQSISNHAEQAVTDAAGGNPDQAANDLQQAAMTIANGINNGSIGQAEGVTLQTDLSTLATTLGLSAASTPPTTPPGPGDGHDHGGRKGG